MKHNTAPEPQFQPGPVIPFQIRVPITQNLAGAQAHLAQAKLLLCRSRTGVRGHRARATLDHLALGCDAAIQSLERLAEGGRGAL